MLPRLVLGSHMDALFTLNSALDHVGNISTLATQGMADTLLQVRCSECVGHRKEL